MEFEECGIKKSRNDTLSMRLVKKLIDHEEIYQLMSYIVSQSYHYI